MKKSVINHFDIAVVSLNSDEAHQFEVKLKKFTVALEHGIEVTMWQLNRNSDLGLKDDFTQKGSQIQVKLVRRGEYLVQGALVFNEKGGYLSKALNRRRGGMYSLGNQVFESVSSINLTLPSWLFDLLQYQPIRHF